MTRETGKDPRVDSHGVAIDAPNQARLTAILNAGVELFLEQGFNRTTTDDVAARAGVTKRTLYRYVGSKQALLFAVCSQLPRRLEEVADTVSRQGATDQFRELIAHAAEAMLDLRQVVLVYLAEGKHLAPEQREFLVRHEDAFVARISETLQRGVDDRELRPCDIDVVAQALFGSLAHSTRWYRPDGPLEPGAFAGLMSDLWVNGLLGMGPYPGLGDDPSERAAPEVVGTLDPDESNEAQEKILDVATQIFAEQGFDATSTRSLAEAAQITKGSLHYYVDRKENLLLQIHLRVMAASLRAMDDVRQQDLQPGAAVAEIIRLHLQNVENYHNAIIVFNEESKALGPENMDKLVGWRSLYARFLEDAIAQALAEEGVELPQQQVRIVTRMLLAMLNSAYRWFGRGDDVPLQAVSEELVTLFLHGVRSATGTAPAAAAR